MVIRSNATNIAMFKPAPHARARSPATARLAPTQLARADEALRPRAGSARRRTPRPSGRPSSARQATNGIGSIPVVVGEVREPARASRTAPPPSRTTPNPKRGGRVWRVTDAMVPEAAVSAPRPAPCWARLRAPAATSLAIRSAAGDSCRPDSQRMDVNGMRTSRNTSIETRKPANRKTTPRNLPELEAAPWTRTG